MTKKLKPCPFCGGKAQLLKCDDQEDWSHVYRVECDACDAGSASYTKGTFAEEAWNKRV